MKYRMLKPVIAFGMTPSVGEIVELTTEQAVALAEVEAIATYDVKVERPVKERKAQKKPSGSARPARASTKKTAKRSKPTAKK